MTKKKQTCEPASSISTFFQSKVGKLLACYIIENKPQSYIVPIHLCWKWDYTKPEVQVSYSTCMKAMQAKLSGGSDDVQWDAFVLNLKKVVSTLYNNLIFYHLHPKFTCHHAK